MGNSFKIAVVQACPVFLDRDATITKACRLIAEAAAAGAGLVVFPEAFVPGYPLWVWFIPAGHSQPLRELYAELVANAVAVPGTATDRLCAAAKEGGVTVAIGINELNSEASGTTIYNTLLYIGPDGAILGKHRKVMPTGGERLVWAMGDGSDLEVYDLPFGRLGGLLCWENYMPLARYAMSAWGTEIYVAPTWDRGEPWLSTMRHIAKEGRCYVVGCCSCMRIDDVPGRLAFKEKYLSAVEGWLNPGDSVIVDPDGKLIAGPANQEETILYADADRSKITGPRWQLDVAGHYARPDIFELIVHREPKQFLTIAPPRREKEPLPPGERR
ncbi:MAG TPA: carbon-nitrogen hydrolase family protein [Verrucomicrobiae bacterium]|nr:carbon-nitrogen hydrolase family protein [Verrucomicrobiae bacterium]